MSPGSGENSPLDSGIERVCVDSSEELEPLTPGEFALFVSSGEGAKTGSGEGLMCLFPGLKELWYSGDRRVSLDLDEGRVSLVSGEDETDPLSSGVRVRELLYPGEGVLSPPVGVENLGDDSPDLNPGVGAVPSCSSVSVLMSLD